MGGGGDYYSRKSYSNKSKSSSSSSSYSAPPPSKAAAYVPPVAEPPAASEETKAAVLSSFQHSADKTGIDVAFSFDTTGSMYPCLAEVRKNLEDITARLLKEFPNIRISIIAHGDYCDQRDTYVLKAVDFTRDQKALIDFVRNVEKTGGGDTPECYELVLRDAQSLSWDPNHSKALVLIGDEIPHPAGYTDQDIFWKDHCVKLADAGVSVYGVQALNNNHATPFYSTISSSTGGFHLRLRDFALITEMFVAVCYRAASQEKFDEYQNQLEEKGATSQVKQMLTDLAKPAEKKTFTLTEAWWDRQFDRTKPLYKWDASQKKWVSSK